MNLVEEAAGRASDLAELRHAIHQEPELGLHLPGTQRRVLDALSGLPLEVTEGDELSSVTAVLRGGRPGPTVLLRGDMDALPLVEAVDVPFRSRVDGAMHACGHDLHTTMLVGAAHLLAGHRHELAGNVVFMFQPGEEGFDGAGKMIGEGVLEAGGQHPVAAYALHVFSSAWPHGTFATRSGPIMAASDVLTVTVRGSGGHGSAPHRARDPIPAAAEMTLALQTFITRSIDAFEPTVITVGSLHAGNRYNIIPDKAELVATVRTFDPGIRRQVTQGAERVCRGIAAAHGVEVDVRFDDQYPVTVNNADESGFVGRTVADLFGESRFLDLPHAITGAEDFSRVVDAVPGAMVFLGAMPEGADPNRRPDNHSAEASFDDGVLADGTALYAELAARRLAAAAGGG
ncbi:MAG TPA: M20 family metallopeptidase [Acidimicrobiales bacterium]|nr:M20 family metallopeptidase [Acidimicrobiales bacterium]